MKSNYFDAKELLHDLHRQFAENQNAAAELFVKLLIALLGLLVHWVTYILVGKGIFHRLQPKTTISCLRRIPCIWRFLLIKFF